MSLLDYVHAITVERRTGWKGPREYACHRWTCSYAGYSPVGRFDCHP